MLYYATCTCICMTGVILPIWCGTLDNIEPDSLLCSALNMFCMRKYRSFEITRSFGYSQYYPSSLAFRLKPTLNVYYNGVLAISMYFYSCIHVYNNMNIFNDFCKHGITLTVIQGYYMELFIVMLYMYAYHDVSSHEHYEYCYWICQSDLTVYPMQHNCALYHIVIGAIQVYCVYWMFVNIPSAFPISLVYLFGS